MVTTVTLGEGSNHNKRREESDLEEEENGEKSPTQSSSEEEEEEASSTHSKSKKKRKAKKKLNKVPFNYDRLNPNTNFLSLPIGKPPHFDGTNYTKWKHNMKMHLISLNPSIWQVVSTGIVLPDEDDDEDLTLEQQHDIHRNAQATTVLLSSLSQDQFDNVDGLEVAKDIWDTLKIAHEGTSTMKEAKIELIEGELERFVMDDNETPQEMYNRLKVLINKSRAYGCEKWTNYEVVKRMVRAFTVRNPTICTLLRENPRYKKMTPDEVLGRFINQEMMEKEAIHVKTLAKNAALGKEHDLALKASKSSKKSKNKKIVVEESSSEEDGDSSDSDDENMALFIKRFSKFMKKERYGEKRDKSRPRTKKACYNCGKYGHFISNCPYEKEEEDDDEGKKKKEKRNMKEKKTYKKKKHFGEAHIGKEWDSNDEDSDSDDEGVATVAINASSSHKTIFPNLKSEKSIKHKCFMAKENKRKVKSKSSSSPKYTSSDDESDSDCEPLLKGLSKIAIKKIKKLVEEL